MQVLGLAEREALSFYLYSIRAEIPTLRRVSALLVCRGGSSVSLPLPRWAEKEPYGRFFGDPLSVPKWGFRDALYE